MTGTSGRRGVLGIATSAAILLAPEPARGQTGTIAGQVTQAASGTPLLGVTIALPGTNRGSLVDSVGRFTIGGLAPRGYVVQARRQGYAEAERLVLVRAGETTFVTFALAPSTQVLGGIRTEARAADHDLFLSRPAVATTSITSRAMEAVPRLGEPDVIRVVQLLPGVAAKNDFSTGFNVRGGEADQNLVLIDGYPIYNPFHLGGLFSTFMDATVRDVTLMTGAFPARYGGRLSSVLDVRSAVEARPGMHGSAEVSLLGATGALAGPLGSTGSWMVAARRTYADKVVRSFSTEVLPYHFRDVHAHVRTLLPGQVRFAFTGYGGDDVLDADLREVQDDSTAASAGEGTFFFRWGNSVVGTTLSRAFPGTGGDSLVLEQRFSRSRFSTDVDAGEGSAALRNTVRDARAGGEVSLYGTAHQLTVGYEVSRLRTATVDGSPQAQVNGADLHQDESGIALFADDLWKPSPASRWLIQGGLRYERFGSGGWHALSPRLSAKYFLRPDLAVTLAGGRFSQWVHSLALEDSPIRLFDFWLASDSRTPVATATHAVAGLERWFPGPRQLRVEAFFKDYDRLLEANLTDDPFVVGDEFVPMRGFAYGFDLLLRQFETSDRRLSGWVSYNYAVTSREQDGVRYYPGHDRRHNLNAVASWRAGKYLFGARLGIAGGTPYTEMVGQFVRRVFDPATNTWEFPGAPPRDVTSVGGPRNGARYPLTQRLDLNVSRDYERGRATIRPFLSVVNAYNAKNVFLYILDYGEVPPIRRTISQFPFLPSAGVSVVF
ncbi:MAG TPA: TonB-dependent receptor [Gemmatimonadaceae bacterium]